MPKTLSHSLRRITMNSHFFFALKVMVAILGSLIPALAWGMIQETVILSLGVVAGAIGEPDDSVPGRIKNLGVTMLCFVIATVSVQLLYPYPWLFAAGLFLSTIGFIMLGAFGPRYATISFGSLLVAIYSMLGAAHSPHLWFQPLWLCVGALWYGIVSLLWLKALPHKAVHEQLAQVFFALSQYFYEKSHFFPVQREQMASIRHNLGQLNISCISNMQITKEMLSGRLTAGWDPHLERLLQLYLLAQEIHERVVASHYLYDRLQDDLQSHAILDGFREVLEQLGNSSKQLGYAILMQRGYAPEKGLTWVMSALRDQLAYIQLQQEIPGPLRSSLVFLQQNLAAILQLFEQAAELTEQLDAPISQLSHRQLAKSPSADLKQVSQQLVKPSPLFFHALRMAVCLVSAYGLLQLFAIQQGFWVLLTCLFVCQSSYTDTRRRIFQRIGGTLLGILLGTPLIWLSPTPQFQLFGMAVAAILFFSQLRSNYSAAVTFITLYALSAFGLLGVQSNVLLLPRLFDTLLGAGIAFIAVMGLWPEWQHRHVPQLLQNSLQACKSYLQGIVLETSGGSDELHYRIVRRQAHVADNALARAWQNMLAEPKDKRRFLRVCAALTQRSHTLIAYISTLGAHRALLNGQFQPAQSALVEQITQVLDATAATIAGTATTQGKLVELDQIASLIPGEDPDAAWLIQQELQLVAEQANELLRLSWLLDPLKLTSRH
jgi:YccS/YhfK family integral membrane protein